MHACARLFRALRLFRRRPADDTEPTITRLPIGSITTPAEPTQPPASTPAEQHTRAALLRLLGERPA
ncbi:hypothetical protein P3T37_001310 [Kitasatospora sp. MAA4]|uniref:hypothetical protein n=1 Tax=Kitasatospora sp. MAA4 TaxID=3035093 RepID=UPI0024732F8B|nr:hypothetical protein [Kitasatospora sp. MAA4]MDH6131936.1 hypothetical protein [Kitasatospora sp. MAA4]